MSIEIHENYFTKNECYQKANILSPKGIMVHSTACPGVPAKNFLRSWNTFRPNGVQVCVHAFIDDTGVYQTLPFGVKGWHSGKGSKGSANSLGYIGFEVCEPKNYEDVEYFKTVKQYAVEFVAYLCKTYNISYDKIITHCEGYKMGIASNHADIDHWWLKFQGYSMEMFRKEVADKIFYENLQKDEVESMTKEELKIFIEDTVKSMGSPSAPSAWAKSLVEEAVAAGITDSSNPQRLATREEVMIMALRASQK